MEHGFGRARRRARVVRAAASVTVVAGLVAGGVQVANLVKTPTKVEVANPSPSPTIGSLATDTAWIEKLKTHATTYPDPIPASTTVGVVFAGDVDGHRLALVNFNRAGVSSARWYQFTSLQASPTQVLTTVDADRKSFSEHAIVTSIDNRVADGSTNPTLLAITDSTVQVTLLQGATPQEVTATEPGVYAFTPPKDATNRYTLKVEGVAEQVTAG